MAGSTVFSFAFRSMLLAKSVITRNESNITCLCSGREVSAASALRAANARRLAVPPSEVGEEGCLPIFLLHGKRGLLICTGDFDAKFAIADGKRRSSLMIQGYQWFELIYRYRKVSEVLVIRGQKN